VTKRAHPAKAGVAKPRVLASSATPLSDATKPPKTAEPPPPPFAAEALMRRIAVLSVALILAAGCKDPTQPGREDVATPASFNGDDNGGAVVQVARPTGKAEKDVANIKAAVAAATPGAVIQFARGTYRILETTQIIVSVPGVTLQGDSRGTTIRGITASASDFLVGHFLLNGGDQTVRDLTFEGFATALSFGEVAPAPRTGGYRVENSTFRNGDTGVEFVTFSDDVSTVRDNKFINVTFQFFILGKTVHFLGNSNTNPKPEATPPGRPFNAGVLFPEFLSDIRICENNLVEGNTVTGNADGFVIATGPAGSARNNVIRRNTFIDQRVFVEEDGTTGDNASMVVMDGPGVERNLIEENVLRGSEGLGIVLLQGNRNRIIGNKFFDLPGERPTFTPSPGTAIFLGEASAYNEVRENEFHNVVNTIVDLGTKNKIGPGQGNGAFSAVTAPRLSVTGRASRMLDHPKLRFLRDRMKN
jgi:parallel beta-helix repeat protein